jgi:hypothetical protein
MIFSSRIMEALHHCNTMRPSARIPTVEFRSLLLPPIRVSLRALQSLHRPQCLSNRPVAGRTPQCLAQQRRSLVLYKTATSKTVLGQQKVLPFDLYKVGSPGDSAHEVNLVRGGKTIAENISLEELYEKHVKPGQLIHLTEAIEKNLTTDIARLKEKNTQLSLRTFGIFEPRSIPGNKKDADAGKGRGALRVTALNLSSPPKFFQLALDRSYQFIEYGSPVEFTIAIKRSRVSKEERLKGSSDKEAWPWIHEHFPHLRPDFILKSMPEGSMWAVEPVTDGRILQFVIICPSTMNRNPVNHTKRLFSVKESVQKHIATGRAQQLPSAMRRELQESGHLNYSPLSSMPVKLSSLTEEAKRAAEQETEEWNSPESKDRYMPLPEKTPKYRTDKLSKTGVLLRRKSTLRKTSGRAEPDTEGLEKPFGPYKSDGTWVHKVKEGP